MDLSVLKLTSRRQGLLAKMGIASVEDLLETYPFRYETIEIVPYDQWQENDHVCFEGLICQAARVIRLGKNRSMTKFTVISYDQEIEVTLFNRPWTQQFTFGKDITVFGQYKGKNKFTATNYNFEPLSKQVGMHPVYTLPQGMHQKEFQKIMDQALAFRNEVEDVIPHRYREKYRLLEHGQALLWVHHPQDSKHLRYALRTLKYEEFLCFQCVMQATQNQATSASKDPKIFDESLIDAWIHQLPYPLTKDQAQAIDDVCEDLHSSKTMFRLVQGDVGCGKTIVAMAAIYASYLAGYQSAFLAPTEILARQHYEKMRALGLDAQLYVSALSAKEKQTILDGMASGEMLIFVGTHALFQDQVHFSKLGLVIADEQQRFGVRQRRSMLEKGKNVDFLMMSATPIPRTYAHFIYGNMDISNIKTMPPHRKPVITTYIKGTSMKPILPDILEGLDQGRQCYVVCAAIEDSTEVSMRSATKVYEGMKKTLKKRRIGLLHGQMSSEEKEAIMNQFVQKELDLLVSTTVIEVGIDVPDATMMVIYDAHRFGLSTLHQLRGRVARGDKQGYCWLLSDSKDPQAIERLKKLETITDGFAITEYDLRLRGPGDFLGVRQSGLPNFVLGDLEKDKAMMDECVKNAEEILQQKIDQPMLDFISKAIANAQYFD